MTLIGDLSLVSLCNLFFKKVDLLLKDFVQILGPDLRRLPHKNVALGKNLTSLLRLESFVQKATGYLSKTYKKEKKKENSFCLRRRDSLTISERTKLGSI